jgi:hypothetical protein
MAGFFSVFRKAILTDPLVDLVAGLVFMIVGAAFWQSNVVGSSG